MPTEAPAGRRIEAAALTLVFLAAAAFTVLGFARGWQPPAASEHAAGVDRVIRFLMIATGAVFLIGHVVLAGFVWRYARRGDAARPETTPRAERAWSLVPVFLMTLIAEGGMFVLALPVWGQMVGAAPEDALVVEVTGRQFEWWIRYAGKDGKFGRTDLNRLHPTDNPMGLVREDRAARDDLVFLNEMWVPAGRTVVVQIHSRDVLHSFSVPAFRVKQDAVPGMRTFTKFLATKPGDYEIACAEVCGLGHYRMRGVVHVLAADQFDRWFSEQVGWFE
jgi:cytochrome c oxidase subunit 2